MSVPTIAEMLKHANLQMAAEAIYNFRAKRTPNQTPGDLTSDSGHFSGEIDPAWLTLGNEHASRFTQTEAEKFVQQWEVVDHISNTTTGFSGTLFRDKDTNEYVISLRSTEFIDDVARDCVATNAMEIKAFGWAFGQISDMENWYQSIKSKIDSPLSVTGYSLGGHLATAFNLLRREDGSIGNIDSVVTFNGAGVGNVTNGTLGDVMADFQAMRDTPASIAACFADPRLGTLYNELRLHLADGHKPTAADYALINAVDINQNDTEYQQQQFAAEKNLLWSALDRIANLKNAVEYLGTVTDSKDGRPAAIPEQNIVQESFEYQMAVLWAQEGRTEAMGLIAGGINTVFGKEYGTPRLTNQYDVVGRETTTTQTAMVSDSQWHYGTNVDLFIEDQPLVRGTVIKETAGLVWDTGAMLPISEYGQNDFGDTHSLVLIVDSLNVQNTLLNLLPADKRQAAAATLNTVFKEASWRKAESTLGTQGQAEGDVLENVVNALADLFLGPQQKAARLNGSPDGNTWAKTDATFTSPDGQTYSGHEKLYVLLNTIIGSAGYKALSEPGKLQLEASTGELASRACTDFGAFAALYSLSPFVLKLEDQTIDDRDKVGSAWGDTYTAWKDDLAAHERNDPNYEDRITDTWLADRAEFLRQKNYFNAANEDPYNPDAVEIDGSAMLADAYFEDIASSYKIQQGRLEGSSARRYFFGAEEGDTFTGGDYDDHLYGGGGNDQIDGGKGADYLEGNEGDDTLLGGEGADRLYGGAGYDTYVIGANVGSGADIVRDADGLGVLRLGSANGPELRGSPSGYAVRNTDSRTQELFKMLWRDVQNPDIYYGYAENANEPETHTLAILRQNDGFEQIASIERFENGKLGLTFKEGHQITVVPASTRNPLLSTQGNEPGGDTVQMLSGAQAFRMYFSEPANHGDQVRISIMGDGADSLRIVAGDESVTIENGTLLLDLPEGSSDYDFSAVEVPGGSGGEHSLTLAVEYIGGDGEVEGADNLVINSDPTWQNDPQGDFSHRIYGDMAPVLFPHDLVPEGITHIDELGNVIVSGPAPGRGDSLRDSAGNDLIDGRDGDDFIYGFRGGNDLLYGGKGDDVVWYLSSGDATLDGGEGNDMLRGGEGSDVLLGGSGSDVICKNGTWEGISIFYEHFLLNPTFLGNNYADGGADNDEISIGGTGNDLIIGGAGDDRLNSLFGDDFLDGGDGNDRILGGPDDDHILGGNGADKLHGDLSGSGFYYSEVNRDGLAGNDYLSGGNGDDFIFGDGGADILIGGDGIDVLVGDDSDEYPSSLPNQFMDSIAESTHYGNDWLDGGAGADHLYGNAGSDYLIGGLGNDVLHGDTSHFNVRPGEVFNKLPVELHGNDTLEGGDGEDDLYGDGGNDVLFGGSGFDFLDGGAGDDFLDGGSGGNLLQGGSGNDVLVSGTGACDSAGGLGNDIYLFDAVRSRLSGATHDYIEDGGQYDGWDIVRMYGVDLDVLEVFSEDDGEALGLRYGYENTLYVGFGSTGALNAIDRYEINGQGYTASELIHQFADGPVQLMYGDEGLAVIAGAGNDFVLGGSRDDLLDGGAGNDVTDGGTGDDLYVFYRGAGNDTIQNAAGQNGGADTLELRGLSLGDVLFVRRISDVAVVIKDTKEEVVIRNFFDTAGSSIEHVVFGNGEILDREAILEINQNHEPVLESPLAAMTVSEDAIFQFTVPADTFADIDAGDKLTFSASLADGVMLPTWLSFDPASRTFYGVPGNVDVGALSVRVTATDTAGASVSTNLNVAVANTNDGPVVVFGVAPQAVNEDSIFRFILPAGTFADEDVGDVLTFSATLSDGSALPSWLTFDAATRTFSGTPENADVGALSLHVTATDTAGAAVSADFDMAIANINDAPVVAMLVAAPSATEGSAYRLTVPSDAFADVDVGDVLTLSATLADDSALPAWLSFDAATRSFSGTPAFVDTDTLNLKLTATDVAGASVSQSVELKVDAVTGITLVGTAGNDTLTGTALNDTLDGGAGRDRMIGGAGNDIYVVENSGDVVVEVVNEGIDLVRASVTTTLAANVENLTLIGSSAINGTGNALDNVLTGNSVANVLAGGAGNDTYYTGSGDRVSEAANAGIDTVISDATWTLSSNLENLTLTGTAAINGTGNTLNNLLIGNGAANVLSGGSGADNLIGGAGNDTYVVDNIADVVVEAADEGADLVQSSISHSLSADVENLNLTGTAAINGTGNTLDNALNGNAGANILDGGFGNDTMVGGAGNDTYVVDSTGDVVIENAAQGTDTVKSTIDYALGANIENLTLLGGEAINGAGNELNNVLIGNGAANELLGGAGNDTLNGGAGADSLAGGLGNDTYVVDNNADAVIENAGEGTDFVQSSVSYTLASNIENLTLTGVDTIDGLGNELNNSLVGNIANNALSGGAGNDTLNGGAGTDTLTGGLGNDIYVVDNADDVVVESAAEGTDTVQSSVNYSLAGNVENLTLTGSTAINGTGNELNNALAGNSVANTLTGGAGNDTLNGGADADTLIGGAGNDTYVVDNVADAVVELEGEGTDTVQAGFSYTLGATLENLTLTGTAGNTATGNMLANSLAGNAGNNLLIGLEGNDTLNGGAGADTMIGGVGNDNYYVDNVGDEVTDLAGEGTDRVYSTIDYALGNELENLTLSGTAATNGFGNSLSNSMTGNTASNLLSGGDGNDTLNGAAGNDLIEGGAGNDVLTDTSGTALFNGGAGTDSITGGAAAELYLGGLGNDTVTTTGGNDVILFNKGDGQDTFATGGTGSDTVSLGGGIAYTDLSFSKSSNDLILKTGGTDQITFKNWYAATPSKPVLNLQMIAEAMADFDAGGSDPLRDQKVENFNFAGLAGAFDVARTANPGLTSWALTNALVNFQLAGSDTAAIGGDLAYQYGKNGTVAGIGLTAAQQVIGDANFGSQVQTLRPLAGLQEGAVRLS